MVWSQALFLLAKMTIKQARKLLGSKYSYLSDKEIELRIKKLGLFAESLVDATLEKLATINTNETSDHFSQSLIS